MQIISHRGYWQKPEEKNSQAAFVRSFSLGFGTETDVRDHHSQLVISHDPPSGKVLTLDELLELAAPSHLPLAINVKADGLASEIRHTMNRYNYQNWFVFDMSIPDLRAQLAVGNPSFVRMSEVESMPAYLHAAAGVWLDAFESDEWRIGALQQLAETDIRTCIVSPELHHRDYLNFWKSLKVSGISQNNKIILCTDFPETASQFFEKTP